MCVIGHQPGPMLGANGRQISKRSEVAVHGKDGLGDDESMSVRAGEQSMCVLCIIMAKEPHISTGKLHTGMQAGMCQFIHQDKVARAGQHRHNANIGQVAGPKHARGGKALEGREPRFELMIERMIAGHQAGAARADAVFLQRFDASLHDPGMRGKAKIIVVAE